MRTLSGTRRLAVFSCMPMKGGIPPRNKIKVQTGSGDVIRLQSTHIGHHLQEGDQIVLGETALLQFSYNE